MSKTGAGQVVAAALGTAFAGPAVRAWLRRKQSFDHPNERSSHSKPIPRGGGLACSIGGLLGAGYGRRVGLPVSREWFATSSLLAAVGRADDVSGLAPTPRLAAQVAAGTMVGARVGGLTGLAFGAAAVPAIVNAFNFMDGINGISGGTSAAWGLHVARDRSQGLEARAQAAVTAGMGLGFLPFNVPKASMFLGDVGSYLLGSSIAVTIVQSAFRDGRLHSGGAAKALAPLAPYLADTGTTILRRFLRGESVTVAHRDHAYQRLVIVTDWPHWVVASLVVGAAWICGEAGRRERGVGAIGATLLLYLMAPTIMGILIRRCGNQVQSDVWSIR